MRDQEQHVVIRMHKGPGMPTPGSPRAANTFFYRFALWFVACLVISSLLVLEGPNASFRRVVSTNAERIRPCFSSSSPKPSDELTLDLEGFSWGTGVETNQSYFEDRKGYGYYRKVLKLAEQYGVHAQSIIDVGAPWPFVTAFTWIPDKTMLNDRYPEGFKAPSSVKLVEADFYNFNPPQKYDIVLCNQVLEHVPDPTMFAKKLMAIGNVVITTVPHRWPPGPPGHVHHRINQTQLLEWFGNPRYSEVGIIQETHKEAKVHKEMMQRLFLVVDTRVKGNEQQAEAEKDS